METIFTYINGISNNNQIISGLISLWGLTVITYILKVFPLKIFNFIVKHLTTEMIITTNSPYYSYLMEYFELKDITKKMRKLKIKSKVSYYYLYEDDFERNVKGVGYGSHIVFLNGSFMKITLKADQKNQTSDEKDEISLTILGRNHKKLDKILTESFKISKGNQKHKNDIYVSKMKKDNAYLFYTPKRDISTLFLEDEIKDKIFGKIDNFLANEDFYLKNGIPYQLGIILHGKPGCGKTSLIKAIASKYNKEIAIVNAQNLEDITHAIYYNPQSIIVVEDIDSNSITHKRETTSNENNNNISDMMNKSAVSSLSEILNDLDGLISTHGRLLIVTTNHLEKLDPALIRPGRFDLIVEIPLVNVNTMKLFLKHNFPDFDTNIIITLKHDISIAKLQNEILDGKELDYFIQTYCDIIQ